MVVNTNSTNKNSSFPYSIQQLQCTQVPKQSCIYKTIEFQILHQFCSIDNVQITLHFTTDLCRRKAHQPTSVDAKIISPLNHVDDILYSNKTEINKKQSAWSSSVLQHLEGTVSDVEDDDDNDDINNNTDDPDEQNHYEFIESTIRSFRTLPIQKAIQTVTDAMTEY